MHGTRRSHNRRRSSGCPSLLLGVTFLILSFSGAQAACEPSLHSYLEGEDDLSTAYLYLQLIPRTVAVFLPSEAHHATLFVPNDAAFSLDGPNVSEHNLSGFFLFNSLPRSKPVSTLLTDRVEATNLAEVLSNASCSLTISGNGTAVMITSSLEEDASANILRSVEICGSWIHIVDDVIMPPRDMLSTQKGGETGLPLSKGRRSVLVAERDPKGIASGKAGGQGSGVGFEAIRRLLREVPVSERSASPWLLGTGGVVGCGIVAAAAAAMLGCFKPIQESGEDESDDEETDEEEKVDRRPRSSVDLLLASMRLKAGRLKTKRKISPPTTGSSQATGCSSQNTGSSDWTSKSPCIRRGPAYRLEQGGTPCSFMPSSQLAEQMREQSMVSCESLDDEFGTGESVASLRSIDSTWEMNSWEVDSDEVQICLDSKNRPWQLGSGGFGRVFRAEMAGSTPVAVKFVSRQSPRELTRFAREIGILKSLRHTNIVQFLGAFMEGAQMVLVTEYMVGGDLYNVMGHDLKRNFGWYKRGQQVALDIIRGVVHMHARKIIHLDLKSANILLSRDGTAKIADVGLAKVLSREMTHVSMESTFDWAAPEVLAGLTCSEKSDIWSLGVVLWEIVSGEAPRLRQLRPVRVPEECPAEVKDVIVACRASKPEDRPTAREVFNMLSAVISPDAPRPASSVVGRTSIDLVASSRPRPTWAPPEHPGGEEEPSYMASISEDDPEGGVTSGMQRLGSQGLPARAQFGLIPAARHDQYVEPPAWVRSQHLAQPASIRSTSL